MALSGYDSFWSCLHRIEKQGTAACRDRGAENTSDRIIFFCSAIANLRQQLQEALQTLDSSTPSEWSTVSFAVVMFRSTDHSKIILQHLHDIMQHRFTIERKTTTFTKRNQRQCYQSLRTGDHCWKSDNRSSRCKCICELVAARRNWTFFPDYIPLPWLKTTNNSRKRISEQTI